jgi:hypothetical protein
MVGLLTTYYAFFAGGLDGDGNAIANVDTIDENLLRRSESNLVTARYDAAATVINGKTLVVGGRYPSDGSIIYSKKVDVYSQTFTHSTFADLYMGRANIGVGTIGEYVICAGGAHPAAEDYVPTSLVETYKYDGTHGRIAALSVSKSDFTTVATNDYILFAGGKILDGATETIDVYDASLEKLTSLSLEKARYDAFGIVTSNYILIIGGYDEYGTALNDVEIFTKDLTKVPTTLILPNVKGKVCGFILDDHVFVCGGSDLEGENISSGIDIIGPDLNIHSYLSLETPTVNAAAATVGNYGIVVGGLTPAGATNKIEAFKKIGDILIFPGTKYQLNGGEEIEAKTMTQIKNLETVSGYIKFKDVEI